MQNLSGRRILLVYKARHGRAFQLVKEIQFWLHQNGHETVLVSAECDGSVYDTKAELAVVLGGDGTMLGVARRLIGRGIPLLGINFGRVGFLTDVQPKFWRTKLTDVLSGTFPVRSCSALRWTAKRAGSVTAGGVAINDVVMSRGSLSRLISINMTVNKKRMGMIRGDGVVLSTPLGSTAYSASAGGPLIYPGLEVILFTPICPFITTISPMVFPSDTVFSLQVLPGSTECYITVDGQDGQHLQVGDEVEVVFLPNAVQFVCDKSAFIERLSARCFAAQYTGKIKNQRNREKAVNIAKIQDIRSEQESNFDAWGELKV